MARTKRSSYLARDDDTASTGVLGLQRVPTPKRQQRAAYTCSCSNDGADCCVNRCIEPLAWNIKKDVAVEQKNCPLFSTIPKEIRDLIYEYALTESTFNQPGQVAPDPNYRWRGESLKYDHAENLLLTCKAVYLETFLLPLRLNPLQLPFFDGLSRSVSMTKFPWQFANIQSLDITLRQVELEGDCLYNFLLGPTAWQPEARSNGVFVAPYVGIQNTTGGSCRSYDFTLLPTAIGNDRLHLRDALEGMSLPPNFQKPMSNMRLQRARPIVHLTLRLLSRNWWTWADDPDSTNATHQHLGLEPAVGSGSAHLGHRPTSTLMQELAQQRRNGFDPVSKAPFARTTPGWAHIISKLPDIKTLELVLETFEEKKAQLETVIDCAKTWRFPIAGTRFQLVWNGRVQSIHWSKPRAEYFEDRPTDWYARSTEYEVRIIRFTRRQMVSGSTDTD